VGVCDLSPAAARYAAERFEADAPFTDYQQMLRDAKPDVVHILTPPRTHVPIATDCLEAGAHVMVEKPAAPSNAEFQDLWQVAQKAQRQLIEDHNYRFNLPILAMEEMIADGTLGEVEEVEVRMQLQIRAGGRYADRNLPHPSHGMPAGVIHEFITHLCYLTLRFLPSFERVTAAWSNHGAAAAGDGDPFKFDDLDALVIGGTTHARIRFSARAQPDCFTVTVRGSNGAAETDLFNPFLRCNVPRKCGGQLSPLANQFLGGVEMIGASLGNFRRKILQVTPYEGLHRLLYRTYTALAIGDAPPVTYQDMDSASRLVDALVAEENRA
jgi:predicted dehydrogenase